MAEQGTNSKGRVFLLAAFVFGVGGVLLVVTGSSTFMGVCSVLLGAFLLWMGMRQRRA